MLCPECNRKLVPINQTYNDPIHLYCGYCAKYVDFGHAKLEPGWLNRQIDAIEKEVMAWPAWMRDPKVRMNFSVNQNVKSTKRRKE
jgi:hypothetical protein